MAASAWKVYDSFIPELSTLLTDSFKMAFFTSTLVPAKTDDSYTGLSGELANGNGYTTGGIALTTVAFTDTSGTSTLTFDDVVLTASGADLTVYRAVIYNDTDAGKQLVAQCLLDNTPADVIIYDGLPLTINSSSGALTVTGGAW